MGLPMRSVWILGVILSLYGSCIAASIADISESPPLGKLPDTVQPLHYALDFTIDPQESRFTGETRIQLQLKQATDHIWLHGRDLAIKRATLRNARGRPFTVRYEQRDPSGVALVQFGKELQAGEYELSLRYDAPFSEQSRGLYKVRIGNEDYAITQMEAVGARSAFPGFDEPRFKTPFDVRLTVPKQLLAVANTQSLKQEDSRNKKWKNITFNTTQPLPTYLVAFSVGPYDVVEGKPIPANEIRKSALPLRGMAARGLGAKLDYALAQVGAIVNYYEQYTQQAYPFDKLDLLAINDFSAPAMENAGLIVFSDKSLLLDDSAAPSQYRSSFILLAHEISHQWLGNLVTVPWWDDIWLNEGFASWAQNKATEALKPEMFAAAMRSSALKRPMGTDGLLSARRIRQTITNEGDIENAFDDITYQKGAQILTMVEAWLSEDVFRQAMRDYLSNHAFGSGSANDLIDVLAKTSGQGDQLKHVIRSFLDQPGIPQITTSLDCSGAKPTLKLKQWRYLPYGVKEDGGSLWSMPVCVRFGDHRDSKVQCVLLDEPQASFALNTPKCPAWYFPNANAAGYYHVNLTATDATKLNKHFELLSDSEKILYADAISSAFQRGDSDAALVLDAMPVFATSSLPEVALALTKDLHWIRSHLVNDTTRAVIDTFIQKLYLPRLQQLGYRQRSGESNSDTNMRQELASLLGNELTLQSVRAALLEQGREALGLNPDSKFNLSLVDASLLEVVLIVSVQELGEPAVRILMEQLKTIQNPTYRNAMLSGIGAVRDPVVSEEVRNWGISEAVAKSDIWFIYGAHIRSPKNRALLWSWFQERFESIRMHTAVTAMQFWPYYLGRDVCSNEEANEIEQFFTPQRQEQFTGLSLTLKNTLEKIRQCAALRDHQDKKALARWVIAHPPSSTKP